MGTAWSARWRRSRLASLPPCHADEQAHVLAQTQEQARVNERALLPRAGVAGVAHVEALDQAFDVVVREVLVGHIEAVLRLDVVPQLGRAVSHLLATTDLDQRILHRRHGARGLEVTTQGWLAAKQRVVKKGCFTRSLRIVATSLGISTCTPHVQTRCCLPRRKSGHRLGTNYTQYLRTYLTICE